MKIKNLWVQVGLIVLLGTVAGLAYNNSLGSPMSIFTSYKPTVVDDAGEDLSVYYTEIDADGLRDLVEADMAVLLDARTAENYGKGFIPRAVSLPVGEFQQKYDGVSHLLTEDKTIIVYCIDLYCPDSSTLAKKLHDKGHREIFVYKPGFEEWQQLGYPIEGEGGQSQ